MSHPSPILQRITTAALSQSNPPAKAAAAQVFSRATPVLDALDSFQAGADCLVVLTAIHQRLVAAKVHEDVTEGLEYVIASLCDDIGLLDEPAEAFEQTAFGGL